MAENNEPIQTKDAGQQWEYKRGNFSLKELNELGQEKWEAIGVTEYDTLLKRPKQQNKQQSNDYYGYGH